jgi:predicted CoA-binding protein
MIIEKDDQLFGILAAGKTIAVVGASVNQSRDSNRIMKYLLEVGYKVIPVNPNYRDIFGIRCYPNVTSIGEEIDIVDVFRRSEFVDEITYDAIEAKAKTLWLQLGVINPRASQYASDHGLNVVINRCIMVEHRRLLGTR